MSILLNLILLLVVVTFQQRVICSVVDPNYFNRIDSHRATPKINFLKQEIQIPDGVGDALVSEIQKLLNYYEHPLLKLRQELINCDEYSGQNDRCLEGYSKLKEIELNLRKAQTNLNNRFVGQSDSTSKQSKVFFGINDIFGGAFEIFKDYSVLLNFQFSVMKSTPGPSTISSTTASPSTAPSTAAPSTAAPSTSAPSTAEPSTSAPSTSAPSTDMPSTAAPTTAGTTTDVPTTTAMG